MIKKLKTIANTEDKKRLFGNFISLSVLRGFDFLIPLITLPYLVRVIGIESFGLINFALSLALYFGAIIQYGFGVTATREIARNRDNAEALAKIYSATLSVTLLLSFVCTIAFTLLVLTIDKFNEYLIIYFSSIALTVMQSLFPIWFFQGMERMKFIAYLTLTARTLFLIGLFLFVTQEDDFYLVPLLNGISAFVSFISAIWLIKYRFKVSFILPEISDIKRLLKEGRHAFVIQLAPNLYNNSSTFLLGLFTNNMVVGYYSAATKVIDALISIGHILSNTFLPYLSRKLGNHKLFQIIMLVIGMFLTLIAIAFAELIVRFLFTEQNLIISEYIQWLSISVLMIFVQLTYSTNYLMLSGQDKTAKNIALYTSMIFLMFALIIIPWLGIWGAIATLVGARTIMGLLSIIFYKIHSRLAAG